MSWTSFIRAVAVPQRSRPPEATVASRLAVPDVGYHRHPAMIGIDVSPVHGRHCICDRCLAQLPKAG